MKKHFIKCTLLSLAFTLAGCAINKNAKINITGEKLPAEAVSTLEVGKSTYSDMVKLFGTPTSSVTKNNTKTVTYTYTKVTKKTFGIIFIIMDDKTETETQKDTFVFINNILNDYYSN